MIKKTNLLSIVAVTNNLKILYVEDNKESREQTLKMLKNYFLYIDVAVDGADGLECYNNYFIDTNNYYDLIITDISMPNINGIEMSKAIYKINKEQKIIVISAYSDKKYLVDLINIGVEGFLQKPLSFEQISDALSEICKSFMDYSMISLSKNCTYNRLLQELFLDNKKIKLTKNEQKFMEFLIKNYNHTFSVEEIFNYIYYDDPQKNFSIDSIKGLVKRLRKKLPEDLILYNRAIGYSICID